MVVPRRLVDAVQREQRQVDLGMRGRSQELPG
jgi:hypothetical protein